MTRGNLNPDDDDPTRPPSITLAPIAAASVSSPLALTALVTDDGLPKLRPPPKQRSGTAAAGQVNITTGSRPRGLTGTWLEYRGPAKVVVDPAGPGVGSEGKA